MDALAKTTDEELSKMLIEVRGIGQVSIYMLELLSAMIHERRNTSGNVKFHSGRVRHSEFQSVTFRIYFYDKSSVDMFAIFSLRRPDILPVGAWLLAFEIIDKFDLVPSFRRPGSATRSGAMVFGTAQCILSIHHLSRKTYNDDQGKTCEETEKGRKGNEFRCGVRIKLCIT